VLAGLRPNQNHSAPTGVTTVAMRSSADADHRIASVPKRSRPTVKLAQYPPTHDPANFTPIPRDSVSRLNAN
jgi:hypothetical protein